MGKTDPFLIKMFFQLGGKMRALGTQVSVLRLSLLLLLCKGNLLVSLEHLVFFLILLLSIFGGEISNCTIFLQ